MPDRSSHQGLPEEWNHGSHAARGPQHPAEAPAGFGAGTAGSHRARNADGYDAFGTGADPSAPSWAEAFGTRPEPAVADQSLEAFGIRVEPAGPGNADAFGIRSADAYAAAQADPFAAADPFGTRSGDPFGPAGTAAFSAVPADAGTTRPEAEHPAAVAGIQDAGEAPDARGFLGALFDFGFTSFVTPKVIKVLYLLIVIGTVVSALVFTIVVFKASVTFGVLMLVFGDPLFILIVLAIYRIILEFFVVTFRVAEDIRALRERGDLR